MVLTGRYVPLKGSEPIVRPGAQRKDLAHKRKKLRFTVVVRSRLGGNAGGPTHLNSRGKQKHPGTLTAKEFQTLHGAAAADLRAVAAFARSHEIEVLEMAPERSSVVLSGTIGALSDAFQVGFFYFEHEERRYISHDGPVMVPEKLAGVIDGILGLDQHATFQRHSALSGYTKSAIHPLKIAELYKFPEGATGKGQCIALLQLAGGYNEQDLNAYFEEHQVPLAPLPTVSIAGERNDPVDAGIVREYVESIGLAANPATTGLVAHHRKFSAEEVGKIWLTIEATVDIQLLRILAPEAQIVIYVTPNDSQGIYESLMTALNSKTHPPSVISCSWGTVETALKDHDVELVNKALFQATQQGVTVCCSSGDYGDELKHSGVRTVHFPASSPYVLGCGGTQMSVSSTGFTEKVWNDRIPVEGSAPVLLQSGGGISRYPVPAPDWQAAAHVQEKTKAPTPGRGVPDVAAKSGLRHGYKVTLGGTSASIGGTSVASPLWAALIALLNEKLGTRIGWLTPLLYTEAFKNATNDILHGSNGYRAGPGWDPCSGRGTPNVPGLMAALATRQKSPAPR